MAEKTKDVTVNGFVIKATLSVSAGPPGSPPLTYGTPQASAVCVKLPNGPVINPTGDDGGNPTRKFTFDVSGNGAGQYAVRIDCSTSSWTKVVSVPSQGPMPAFHFKYTEENPQADIPHNVLIGVALPGTPPPPQD
jgi:hypothetical protein